MTKYRYTYDGIADGAAATTANTGANSVNASGTAGSTFVGRTSGNGDGTSHLHLTPVSGGVLQLIYNINNIKSGKIKLKVDSAPVTTANILQLRESTNLLATLQLLGTGQLKFSDWTSASSIVGQGWIRVAFYRPDNGSQFKIAIFSGESTTPIETWTGTPSIGTTPLASFRFGRVVATTDTTPIRWDSVELDDAATDIDLTPFGAGVIATPVISVSAPSSAEPLTTVTVTATATSGTPDAWSWTQTAGPPVTLVGSGAFRTYEAPAIMPPTAVVTVQASATQGNSAAGTATGNTMIMPCTDWSRRADGSWRGSPVKKI